jgi:hypothetical protein
MTTQQPHVPALAISKFLYVALLAIHILMYLQPNLAENPTMNLGGQMDLSSVRRFVTKNPKIGHSSAGHGIQMGILTGKKVFACSQERLKFASVTALYNVTGAQRLFSQKQGHQT